METRKCVFCGGKGLTKEHVFPAWLKNYFGEMITSFNVIDDGSGKIKRWKSKKAFKLTTKTVCLDCNNGWMSSIEATTQPILGPMSSWRLNKFVNRDVSSNEQTTLALWAVKTFYILSSMYPHAQKIPPEDYDYLYKNKAPSPTTVVLLSFRDEPYGPTGTRVAGFYISQATKIRIKPADVEFMERKQKAGGRFYSGHIVLGNVVFTVVGHNCSNTSLIVRNIPPGFAYMLSPSHEHDHFTWPHLMPIEFHGGVDNFQATIESGIAAESLYSEVMDSILGRS